MIKREIRLSEIIDVKNIHQVFDFEYSGIKGCAELIGWKLVFFKVAENSTLYDAISFSDIESKNEAELCNCFLEKLCFPINFNSKPEDVFKVFGDKYIEDHIIEGCSRYHFISSDEMFFSFSVSKERISGIEMVFDSRIANSRINCEFK